MAIWFPRPAYVQPIINSIMLYLYWIHAVFINPYDISILVVHYLSRIINTCSQEQMNTEYYNSRQ